MVGTPNQHCWTLHGKEGKLHVSTIMMMRQDVSGGSSINSVGRGADCWG